MVREVLGWECKRSGVGGAIRGVEREVWFAICKVALQLDKCSDMQADIKGCELLLRTVNEILKAGTLDYDNVEKAVKDTGKR